MAKKKEPYSLRPGRVEPFRRTVSQQNGKSVQIVFEQGVDVDLSADELEQCRDIVESGMIVPATRDAKGRLRVPREFVEKAEGEIAKLEKRVEELSAENEALKARIADWEGVTSDA